MGCAPSSLRGRRRVPSALNNDARDTVSSSIRAIPDFPKKGILFQDVTTLLLDPKAFRHCIDDFVERYTGQPVDVIAGFEARGFIFGPPVALALGIPFVPLRKPGKLPGAVVRVEYELEYGSDTLEMHEDAVAAGQSVVLIDDLVATGGTLAAGVALIERVGGRVHECAAVIELPELRGRDKLGATPLYVQIEKAEHTEEGAAAAAAAAVEHAGN